MPIPDDFGFDLKNLAGHLEATLKWAAHHTLTAGSSATTAPNIPLAIWFVQKGTIRVRFFDRDESDTSDDILLRTGDAIAMTLDRQRTITALQDADWYSCGLTLRLFTQDYTQYLFPRIFVWRPVAIEEPVLKTLMEVAVLQCQETVSPFAYRTSPFSFRIPDSSEQHWVGDGIARALISQVWNQWRCVAELQSYPNPQETTAFPHWMLAVLLHISNNPASATVETMAEIAGMSKSHLNRMFRRYLETTRQKELNRIRMQSACHLLRSTDKTIATIAASVGFESLSHFTRVFTTQYDCSPARFRQLQQSSFT